MLNSLFSYLRFFIHTWIWVVAFMLVVRRSYSSGLCLPFCWFCHHASSQHNCLYQVMGLGTLVLDRTNDAWVILHLFSFCHVNSSLEWCNPSRVIKVAWLLPLAFSRHVFFSFVLSLWSSAEDFYSLFVKALWSTLGVFLHDSHVEQQRFSFFCFFFRVYTFISLDIHHILNIHYISGYSFHLWISILSLDSTVKCSACALRSLDSSPFHTYTVVGSFHCYFSTYYIHHIYSLPTMEFGVFLFCSLSLADRLCLLCVSLSLAFSY